MVTEHHEQVDLPTGVSIDRVHLERERDRQTDSKTDRQADRQVRPGERERENDKQPDIQTGDRDVYRPSGLLECWSEDKNLCSRVCVVCVCCLSHLLAARVV